MTLRTIATRPITPTRRRLRVIVAASLTAAALVASACASEEPTPRPAPAAPTTAVEAPTTTAAPEKLSACQDPAAEDLGDGQFVLDGRRYELIGETCLPRPRLSEPTIEEVPAPATTEEPAPATTEDTAESAATETLEPELTADPVVVLEGSNTFTIEGIGFEPNAVVHLLPCALPNDGAPSADSSADEIRTALEVITPETVFIYCDLGSLQAVDADSEGSFTVQRDAVVVGNLAWIASDIADPQQSAGAVVFVEAAEAEPTTTSVPVDASEDSIADRALAFLAGELGVPENELTLASAAAMTWTDTSLGCPKEGHAYAQALAPGHRFTFSHGSASHDVHSDEEGTLFVRPVGCYEPANEPTTTTLPEPEPTPTTTLPEPELTTTTLPEPEPEVVEEPEPPTTTAPEEPEPEAEQEPALKPWEQETEPEYVWVPPQAGMVPEAWPLCDDDRETWTWRCTPPAEWQRGDGSVDPWGRPDDLPRAADRVQNWAQWCYEWPNVSCAALLFHMSQALDYLGAHPQCVLNTYTDRVEYLSPRGSGADIDYARNSFGWHLCATVIDPLVKDPPAGERDHDVGYRLSDMSGITLAERCRVILTTPFPDIELEDRGLGDWELGNGTPPTRFGQDCDEWAAYVEAYDGRFPACRDSMNLAEEWMEHVHGQNESYWRPKC